MNDTTIKLETEPQVFELMLFIIRDFREKEDLTYDYLSKLWLDQKETLKQKIVNSVVKNTLHNLGINLNDIKTYNYSTVCGILSVYPPNIESLITEIFINKIQPIILNSLKQ
jgi:hypothetical protein